MYATQRIQAILKKVLEYKLLFLIISLFITYNLFAHQGGLNSDGCHNNKKSGDYHCHNKNTEIREDGFRIVDGDTIHFEFETRKVRFSGIDAPEIGQVCIYNSKKFDCGLQTKKVLEDFIGVELPICNTEGLDNYSRELAECFVNGESISKYLVKNGYAFAYRKYSDKFITDEEFAKKNKLGLWKTEFSYPWEYRQKK